MFIAWCKCSDEVHYTLQLDKLEPQAVMTNLIECLRNVHEYRFSLFLIVESLHNIFNDPSELVDYLMLRSESVLISSDDVVGHYKFS